MPVFIKLEGVDGESIAGAIEEANLDLSSDADALIRSLNALETQPDTFEFDYLSVETGPDPVVIIKNFPKVEFMKIEGVYDSADDAAAAAESLLELDADVRVFLKEGSTDLKFTYFKLENQEPLKEDPGPVVTDIVTDDFFL